MPIIDLAFQLAGTTIPLDHGYALFGALCRVVPGLHGDRRIGVHPIRGRQSGPGMLSLVEGSRLRLRLPSEEVASYLALGGTELDLDGHRLGVGMPRVEPLVPAASLGARMVTYRGAMTAEACAAGCRRDLDELGIRSEPAFVPSTRTPYAGQPMRRVLAVKDRRIVGFALRLHGLTAEESLAVQQHGLGGRRRFGCGVFEPIRIGG